MISFLLSRTNIQHASFFFKNENNLNSISKIRSRDNDRSKPNRFFANEVLSFDVIDSNSLYLAPQNIQTK
jgi:hypothetical protein